MAAAERDRGTGLDRQLLAFHDSADRRAMNIAFSKHTLANGLDVLLHEDRACPIVAVNLWYHVGSKNETPGHTGFAHLFEHLMFEGSEHHDRGFFPPLQGAGASLNGSTNADRTNYWELVPSNALELALWMESDRMGFLLPALTDAKFANQRDVVLNERRQNYENRPYGLAPMAMLAALFPPDHPYHWTTIGEIDDLHAAKIDEVREFFRTYYHPANASLAIAGDIDSDEVLDLVRAYFERSARPARRSRRCSPRSGHARRRDAPAPRRSRRAAAPLHRVDVAGDVRGRRRGARSGGRHSRQRQDVAPVPAPRLRTSASRPTCRRRRIRARSPDSCRSRRRRRPDTRSPSSSRRSSRKSSGWRRRGRATTRSSAAGCRPKRSSCSGCRASAALAASPIS